MTPGSIAGLVEVLEQKGILTKQEVRDAITNLRRHTPMAEQAIPPLEAIPEPYVMTKIEGKIIQAILDLLNAHGPHRQTSQGLIGLLNQLINVGQLLARRTAH